MKRFAMYGDGMVGVDGRSLWLWYTARRKPTISPTGFSWGYVGSGPRELARAIVRYVEEMEGRKLDEQQVFKRLAFELKWPGEGELEF